MRVRVGKAFFEIESSNNPTFPDNHFLWRYNRTTYIYYVPYRERTLRLVMAWDEPIDRIPLFRFRWRPTHG